MAVTVDMNRPVERLDDLTELVFFLEDCGILAHPDGYHHIMLTADEILSIRKHFDETAWEDLGVDLLKYRGPSEPKEGVLLGVYNNLAISVTEEDWDKLGPAESKEA